MIDIYKKKDISEMIFYVCYSSNGRTMDKDRSE